MKAFKFISIGGKTFWFNLNESKGGSFYITIVTKRADNKGGEEKITLFPNQIPSFMHVLLQVYAESCKREGTMNYLAIPALCEPPEPVVPSLPDVDESEVPVCPVCEMKPGAWYGDRGLDAVGAIHVFITAETGSYLLLRCQSCNWAPEDSEIQGEGGNKGYGLYHRNSEGYDRWERWAR